MKRAFSSTLAVLLLSGGFLLADSENKILEDLSNSENKTSTYSKLLVICISDDDQARHRFEDKTVTHLRARRIEGMTSYPMAPDLVKIGVEQREEIVATLIGQEVDGIITVRPVALVDRTEEEWAGTWRDGWSSPLTIRQYIEGALPITGTKAKKFGVEITLWDMKSRARVWSGRTSAEKIGKLRKEAGDILFEVINTLVLEGFV